MCNTDRVLLIVELLFIVLHSQTVLLLIRGKMEMVFREKVFQLFHNTGKILAGLMSLYLSV